MSIGSEAGPERGEVCYPRFPPSVAAHSIPVPIPDRPILLTQCPSCQHQNAPGERFCAVCGVPLHLKPCPACGKVDEAGAKICSSCGADFPSLTPDQFSLADEVSEAPADSAGGQARPEAVESAVHEAPANRAWPLIIVALVAGGIPFLWMYRANMPMPKAWQVQAPAAGGAAISSPAAPLPVPPPASSADPKLQASVAEPVREEPAAAPETGKQGPEPAKAVPPRPPANNARPVAKPVAKVAPAGAAKTPARPCTEALAALGLCEPIAKPTGK